MGERRKQIFEVAMEDFIETGHPITSGGLYEQYDFGIKPAMIRRELAALDRDGYLVQTHPSGGRTPTNKAYRLFVQSLLHKRTEQRKRDERLDTLMNEFFARHMQLFTQKLASYLNVLSVVYEPERKVFHNSGLQALCQALDVTSTEDMLQVIRDFERLPHRLESGGDWLENAHAVPQVFVGASPITTSDTLSVIAEQFVLDNENILLLAIGPRRMNYRRSLDFFRSFDEAVHEM